MKQYLNGGRANENDNETMGVLLRSEIGLFLFRAQEEQSDAQ